MKGVRGPRIDPPDSSSGRPPAEQAKLCLGETLQNGSMITLRCVNRNRDTVWIEQRNTRVQDSDGKFDRDRRRGARYNRAAKVGRAAAAVTHKLEAIGLLAGGVAHDFNNMLTVIIGYSDLILDRRCADSSSRRKVERLKKAAERAAELTRQLLAFGRRQLVQPQNAGYQHDCREPL